MKTIVQLFEEIENPDLRSKLFLSLADKKYTYGELVTDCRKMARFFTEKGLQKNDRIIIGAPESWTAICLFFTGLRTGVTPVFLNPDIGKTRAAQILERIQPALVFHEKGLERKWELAGSKYACVPIVESTKKGRLFKKLLKNKSEDAGQLASFPGLLTNLPEGEYPPAIDAESIAYITLTSGSTGRPKPVLLSYRNILTHLETISKAYGLKSGDRILNILRFYQADGIIQGPLLACFRQASLFRPFLFEMNKIGPLFSCFYKYRITHFISVPTMLNLLNQLGEGFEDSFDTEDFRYVVCTAAFLQPKLWERFQERFQVTIINMYGLSETVAGGLFASPETDSHKVGTLGKPLDCTVKIVDEKGEEVPRETKGEICLKGEHIMQGYLDLPEETAAVMQDGWLHTGDLGYLDAGGFVVLSGRKKEVIISGGVNILPNEVTAIADLHPAVLESACVGLPDPVFEQKAVLAVVKKPEHSLSETELIEHCRLELEPARVPHRVFFVTEIPKTISGKVRLRELQNQLERSKPETPGAVDGGVKERVFQAAAVAFKISPNELSEEDTPQTLEGWDSMNHLQFIVNLERRFKVRFTTAEIMSMESLRKAEEILQMKLS